jgi:hypothetical protein
VPPRLECLGGQHALRIRGADAVLAVFLIDHLRPDPDTQDIVNWHYVGASLGASVEKVGEEVRQEEVRQEVHEATALDGKDASAPTTTDDAKP